MWNRLSRRRARLFACACCRRVWDWFPDPRSRAAIEAAEAFADDALDEPTLSRAMEAAYAVYLDTSEPGSRWANAARGISHRDWWAAPGAVYAAIPAPEAGRGVLCAQLCSSELIEAAARTTRSRGFERPSERRTGSVRAAERAAHAELLRDVVGDPFRPAWLDHGRVPRDVVALARAVYENRPTHDGRLDETALAILADAVDESNCADDAVAAHLRTPGPHVRGCWAVDLLLGRA